MHSHHREAGLAQLGEVGALAGHQLVDEVRLWRVRAKLPGVPPLPDGQPVLVSPDYKVTRFLQPRVLTD